MIPFLIKFTIVSGLLFGYYVLFLRNKPFHFFNRFYLLASIAISLVVPLLHIPIGFNLVDEFTTTMSIGHTTPQPITSIVQADAPVIQDIPVASTNAAATGRLVIPWLSLCYGLIVFVLVIRILLNIRRIVRLLRTHPVEKINTIHLIRTKEKDAPFSFHKWLFWNDQLTLDATTHRQILAHETVHIKQRHSLDLFVIELVAAVCWVNPVIHLIKNELKTVHEFLADSVVRNDKEKAVFARLLLMQAMGAPSTRLAHNFFGNITSRRITMITRVEATRTFLLQRVSSLSLAVFTFLLFSFDVKQIATAVVTSGSSSVNAHVQPKIQQELLETNATNDVVVSPASDKVMDSITPAIMPVLPIAIPETSEPVADSAIASNEIHLLNYHMNSVAVNMQMPADNVVPASVASRSDVTQVLLGSNGKKGTDGITVFYPSKKYDELVTIFNYKNKQPLSEAWRANIRITDEDGQVVQQSSLSRQWVTGYETVRIDFSNLPGGKYKLDIQTNDHIYSSSCMVVKDYDQAALITKQ